MIFKAILMSAVCALAWDEMAAAISPPSQPSSASASLWRHAPFVVGAPGRLDMDGDRRQPRRVRDVDSAVRAYADIEEVVDGTWLSHEIEAYAHRAIDCAGYEQRWCRREVRRVAGSRVIFVAAGAHAEIIWPARGNAAVRLGWTRLVSTPVGSMTLDEPPNDFAQALLQEFPSELRLRTWNPDAGDDWRAAEETRLRYYTDQVLAALENVEGEAHRRHAIRFIDENLARIAELRPAIDAAASPHGNWGGFADLAESPDAPLNHLDGQQSTPQPPWCSAQAVTAHGGTR
jgi:hypothetical protein